MAKKLLKRTIWWLVGVIALIVYQLAFHFPAAVEKICSYLNEKGYQFVTLSELFYYRGIKLQNGVIHYDGKGDTDIN
jgi:hypothetical protein